MAGNLDPKRAEAFAARLLNALNDAALCLMASIGHRTGLFDAMRNQTPQTSAEIASRIGLNERYVREWLGAMVTSGVISVDAAGVRYQLPPEHAASLTRSAGADNLAYSRSTSRSSATWRTTSSSASVPAEAFRTSDSHGSMP